MRYNLDGGRTKRGEWNYDDAIICSNREGMMNITGKAVCVFHSRVVSVVNGHAIIS